jgi:hypothetical protein
MINSIESVQDFIDFTSWTENLCYQDFLNIWPEDSWKLGLPEKTDNYPKETPYHHMYARHSRNRGDWRIFWCGLDKDNKVRFLNYYKNCKS